MRPDQRSTARRASGTVRQGEHPAWRLFSTIPCGRALQVLVHESADSGAGSLGVHQQGARAQNCRPRHACQRASSKAQRDTAAPASPTSARHGRAGTGQALARRVDPNTLFKPQGGRIVSDLGRAMRPLPAASLHLIAGADPEMVVRDVQSRMGVQLGLDQRPCRGQALNAFRAPDPNLALV